MEVVGIGRTAAAAVKSGKTIPAFVLRINIAELELIADCRVSHARIYIAEKEIFISYKLMARIEVAPTGSQPDTRFPNRIRTDVLPRTIPQCQVKHKVEERKAASLFMSLDILCCQTVIFLENLRKIRLFDRVGLFIRCYDRLNRHFLESKIGKMQNIFAKIQVVCV